MNRSVVGSGSGPCICSNFGPRNGRFSGYVGQVQCKVSDSNLIPFEQQENKPMYLPILVPGKGKSME